MHWESLRETLWIGSHKDFMFALYLTDNLMCRKRKRHSKRRTCRNLETFRSGPWTTSQFCKIKRNLSNRKIDVYVFFHVVIDTKKELMWKEKCVSKNPPPMGIVLYLKLLLSRVTLAALTVKWLIYLFSISFTGGNI